MDGFPYVNRCPSGLYFDDISKFCTFKNEARCGPIATSKLNKYRNKNFFKNVLTFVAPAPITEPPIDLAKRCDPGNCELPYCFCSKDGTLIPGGLEAEDVS